MKINLQYRAVARRGVSTGRRFTGLRCCWFNIVQQKWVTTLPFLPC